MKSSFRWRKIQFKKLEYVNSWKIHLVFHGDSIDKIITQFGYFFERIESLIYNKISASIKVAIKFTNFWFSNWIPFGLNECPSGSKLKKTKDFFISNLAFVFSNYFSIFCNNLVCWNEVTCFSHLLFVSLGIIFTPFSMKLKENSKDMIYFDIIVNLLNQTQKHIQFRIFLF
jgi:hypothetical protein